jgi:DNA-binding LytR/AlgR family response regulator
MARKSLLQLCAKRPELEVLEVCENAQDALKILNGQEIDILFLDVEMPEMTGLELLNELPYHLTVILTTSKTEYAYDAYQYDVFDYLKKPISLPRFSQTIDKIIQSKQMSEEIVSDGQGSVSGNDIYVKVEGRHIRLLYEDILYVENVGDYVKICTTKESLVVYTTMKNLAEKLSKNVFLRVHRSYIVNLKKIIDIEENSIAIGSMVIPISRSNKQELMTRLNIL